MLSDKSLSERRFQDGTVRALAGYGTKSWTASPELDGTKRKVTYDTLLQNWRTILNRINAIELEQVDLTDQEFDQVMGKVNGISNSYEAAKILSAENSTGKIDGIIRDAPGVTKKRITLQIFKKAEVNGGDTSYQIAREVVSKSGQNRFDLILLINGLPLINIEQKRVDHSTDEAFGQFRRYYQDGEYTHNFFAFSQMMVIMSDIDTRYFATPKSLEAFNPAFQFHWADIHNNPLNRMEDITKTLLSIPMAHQMVGDYLVLDVEHEIHMLMRPYQVEALRAIEFAANGIDNKEHQPHGGYVWHTTGSGKTITSFKAATSLAKYFDKVIFLLDRKDLDQQTSANFKAYSQYESIEVDDSPYTDSLRQALQSGGKGIVVATTFKLNNVINDLLNNGDAKDILGKHMAIIIDEAHRTTMGTMMLTIKSALKNTLFYGFTGTPLFDESDVSGVINEKSERIRTTEQMFGPELHRYTIDQAIKDRNVLGFHVDYIDTGEVGSYEKLSERWVEQKMHELPDPDEDDLRRQAREYEGNHSKDTDGIEDGRMRLEEVLHYDDESHIPVVVERILKNWEKHSTGIVQNQRVPYKFNAILTVARKSRVIAYYEEFKRQLADHPEIHLNISATFSEDNENTDSGANDKAQLARLFYDWHAMGHPQYSVDGKKENGESGFFADITSVFKRGGHALDEKNIDLMIVADRLLTGYDSKLLNTLYVDRQLQLQGLIQAYSRTNRVYGSDKEFGTIINYYYPATSRYELSKALHLYGAGGSSTGVVVAPYPLAVQGLEPLYAALQAALSDPTRWPELVGDEEAIASFLSNYRQVSKYLNLLSQYYEFDWNGTGDRQLALTEDEWLQYQGAYRALRPQTEASDDPEEVELGAVKLIDTQDVTFEEIIRLIGQVVNGQEGGSDSNEENLRLINDGILKLRTYGDNDNATLLQQFMNEVVDPGTLNNDDAIEDKFHEFAVQKGLTALKKFAYEWAIDWQILLKVYQNYQPDAETIDYLDELRESGNYQESEWYKIPENQAGFLPAGNYKTDLGTAVRQWLPKMQAMYGEL